MSTLPPRRQIPPPPRRTAPIHTAPASGGVEDVPRPLGIAARIANLQLNPAPGSLPPYRGSTKGLSPEQSYVSPKPALVAANARPKAYALVLAGLDPDYLTRLLARPPPPVPENQNHGEPEEEEEEPDHHPDPPPRLPPRRLPPRAPPLPSRSDHDHTSNEHTREISAPETYHNYHTREPEDEGLYSENEPDNSTTVRDEPSSSSLFPAGACIKCHDFSVVDAHAAQYPRQYVRSLEELADSLTEPFTYETEKARAIFTWLHHNIQYDTQSFFAGTVKPATAESTLSSGLAVCDGYAGLFVSLAERAGLQVHKVSGHGKGFGYQALSPGEPAPKMSSNHAWNCVLMDGEWRLIDATWGAGVLNGTMYEQRFDSSWFSSSPSEFGKRHFPTDPIFQLISDEEGGPIAWEDYILCPPGPTIFSDFHRLDFLVDLLQPMTSDIERGQTVTFTLFKRCEHLSNRDADNYVYILHFPDRQPVPLEPNAEGGWSLTYRIAGQTEVSLLFVATVDGQDARGIGIRGFTNALNRKAMTFGGLVRWTVA